MGETVSFTPVKVKTEAQIYAVPDTLLEVGPEALSEKLGEAKSGRDNNQTPADMVVGAVVNMPTEV